MPSLSSSCRSRNTLHYYYPSEDPFFGEVRVQDIKEIGIFLFLFSSHFWALHAEVDNFTTILENMLHKGLCFSEHNMPHSKKLVSRVEKVLKVCKVGSQLVQTL